MQPNMQLSKLPRQTLEFRANPVRAALGKPAFYGGRMATY